MSLGAQVTALVGNRADIGRLDAEHVVASVFKVREQRTVVGADVDHEIVFA